MMRKPRRRQCAAPRDQAERDRRWHAQFAACFGRIGQQETPEAVAAAEAALRAAREPQQQSLELRPSR